MADLERIQQNTPGTLSQQWYEDGAAVDPGVVAVTVTRADGTSVSSGNATGTGTNPRTYNLTAANTALLDRFTVTWVSSTLGTLVSYVDVVGGFLFSLAELKGLRLGSSSDTLGARYSTADIVAIRTSVEDAIEHEYGAALVPRYERETLPGDGSTDLRLKWPEVRAVRSATVDGTDLTPSDVEIDLLGLYYTGGWTFGRRNVTVGYEHGLDRPPERIRRGGLLLAKRWLVEGPVDDRTTSMSSEDGTFTLATPGRGGSIFGLPDLDAAIQSSPYRVGVA